MLMESAEPNDLPQLGHLRERFEIKSLKSIFDGRVL